MKGSVDRVDETPLESVPAIDSPARTMGVKHDPNICVSHNEAKHRFETSRDGKTAFLTYQLKPPVVTLLHTEVPVELRGGGIGGILAHAALEFSRKERLKVVPLCPFVAGYISLGHLEYLDLVSPEYRTFITS